MYVYALCTALLIMYTQVNIGGFEGGRVRTFYFLAPYNKGTTFSFMEITYVWLNFMLSLHKTTYSIGVS